MQGKLTVCAASREKALAAPASRYEDRRSVFLGHVWHVTDPQEALAFVDAVRQANPGARHVTYAAVFDGGASERMSDDGEPSGTAGKQILGILRVKGLTDVIVTVTRYFGGIKLGAGGLTRAYSSTCAQALEATPLAREETHGRFAVSVSYAQQETLDHLVDRVGGTVVDRSWGAAVREVIDIPLPKADALRAAVREAFRGRVTLTGQGTREVTVPIADSGPGAGKTEG